MAGNSRYNKLTKSTRHQTAVIYDALSEGPIEGLKYLIGSTKSYFECDFNKGYLSYNSLNFGLSLSPA